MTFRNIPDFAREGSYEINTPLDDLQETIDHYKDMDGVTGNLNLFPDFQRGHIWSVEQQIAYVEFFLKGGMTGRVICFNCPNWGHFSKIPDGQYKDFVIVDGLQRLTALLKFSNGNLPAFGYYHLPENFVRNEDRKYFEDSLRMSKSNYEESINYVEDLIGNLLPAIKDYSKKFGIKNT